MQVAMVGNKLMQPAELDPVYQDRGLYFGDGIYEVLRSYNGKIFALEEHLDRFTRGLAAIEISSVDVDEVRRRVLTAFEAAGIANAKIYFHVTRGSGPRDHLSNDTMKPNFFLTISELKDTPALKEKGVAVSTYPDLRWKRCDIKSLNLLPNVLARRDAAKKNCWEAVFVDDRGLITEGAASAFFAVIAGKLRTSPLSANILPSVTRKFVLKAAANIGLDIVDKSVTPAEAEVADELFLAVTTRDIIPVVKFNAMPIANSIPGRRTEQLIEEFKKFTK